MRTTTQTVIAILAVLSAFAGRAFAQAPAAPTDLALVVRSSSQVDMTWQDNSNNEDSFHIYRSTDNATYWHVGDVGANVTSFSDESAAEFTFYYYRVYAYNGGAGSLRSNVPTAQTPLAIPTNAAATAVSPTRINVSWTNSSTKETGYSVERSVNGGAFAEIATTVVNAEAYGDTTVTEGNTYTYRIRTQNGTNYSAYSAEVTTVPLPTAPSSLAAATNGGSRITLTWTDNSSSETGFAIQRVNGGTFAEIATVGAGVTTYIDNGLDEITAYTYRVCARNAGGDSPWSNQATATTLHHEPTGLIASTASASQINLAWTDNSAAETGYAIERSLVGGAFVQIATLAANTETYSDSGLPECSTYVYRVRALAATPSLWSNEATGGTLPVAPSNLVLTGIAPQQMRLDWTDNSNAETGFVVEFGASAANCDVIATLGPNVTTYTHTGATTNGGTYRVRAYSAAGRSAYASAAGSVRCDLGDAPDSYGTLLSSNGAWHVIASLRLGSGVSFETDGKPYGLEAPDYNDDGISSFPDLVQGQTPSVTVTVSADGMLDAWIDFNKDGDWDDAGEQVFASQAVTTGDNALSIAIPAGATIGETFARFRVSTAGGLGPRGGAIDGEVEDYKVTILSATAGSIRLSNNCVAEGRPSGSAFGALSVPNVASARVHTFELATGTGDTDNSSFTITGTQLQTAAVFDSAVQATYSIRVSARDDLANVVQQQFTIHVVGSTIYVATDGDDANTGASWASPVASLQIGIDRAKEAGCSEVWVKAGTYKPNSRPDDPTETDASRENHYQLANGVAIYGGFAGTELLRNQRDHAANPCILSGDIGVIGDKSDNILNMIYHPMGYVLDSTAVLDGFTIRDGNAEGSGGGLYDAPNSAATYRNCVFSHNTGSRAGGGIIGGNNLLEGCTFEENTGYTGGGVAILQDDPSQLIRFTNCTIRNNTASHAAGVHAEEVGFGARIEFESCKILNNTSTGEGGGVLVDFVEVSLNSCLIAGNRAEEGGGMLNYGAVCTVSNCEISGNTATEDGGGLASTSDIFTETEITNSTISGNTAANDGGAIHFGYGSATVSNCNISENTAVNGGGIRTASTNAQITGTTFEGNMATGDGGGAYIANASSKVSDCRFQSNQAQSGGGVYVVRADRISSSTFTANSAASGGALYSASTAVSNAPIVNCTLVRNTANGGPGVYVDGDAALLISCTLVANVPSTGGYNGQIYNTNSTGSYVLNCVIWDARSFDEWSPVFRHCVLPDAAGTYGGNTNADPKLGVLGAHGGATRTYPIQTGSSAINTGVYVYKDTDGTIFYSQAGSTVTTYEQLDGTAYTPTSFANCFNANDQRGVARQGLPDIGAYEHTASAIGSYYRSAADGNWSALATWECSPNGVDSWAAADKAPCSTDETIVITHDVTVDMDVAIDQTTVTGSLTVAASAALSVVDATGTDLQIGGSLQNNGTLEINGGSVAGTAVTHSSTATLRYAQNASTTSVEFPQALVGNLEIAEPASVTLNEAKTIRDLTIQTNASLSCSDLDLQVSGNIDVAGSFSVGTNTVTLTGSNQSISGNLSFYELVKDVSSADTLTCEAGKTITILSGGALTLTGRSGALLKFRSSVPGSQWNISAGNAASRTIQYVDVQDSKSITEIVADDSVDSGNNINWIFGHTITASSTSGGSVSPTGDTRVNHGHNQAYAITVDAGYQVSDVEVDGSSIGVISSYTFINVTADHTISASFVKTSCVVTAVAGANGRVAMDGAIGTTLTQTVVGGSTTTPIFAQADSGYRFVQWSDGNTDNPRTLTVTDDITITAEFTAYNQPPVAVASATPETMVTTGGQVDLSASGSYDPDNGPNPLTYSWTVVSAPAATTITDDDQTDASFTPSAEGTYVIRLTVSDGADSDSADVQVIVGNLHVVTVNAGTGGKVQLAGGEAGASVQEGVANGATSSTFTAVADAGYDFAGWSDASPAGASRSFINVTADTTVTATFTKTLHTVTFVLGSANGELVGSTTQNVANGADCSPVSVIPNAGYRLVRWEYGTGSTSTDNPVTITGVSSDLTVTAVLALEPYDVVATAGAGGSISPVGTTTVYYGNDLTYTITPDADYIIGTVIVDGVTVGAPSSYTFTNIQADHSIEVVFFSSTGSGGRVVTIVKKDDGGCTLGSGTGQVLPVLLLMLCLLGMRFRLRRAPC